MSMKEIIGSLKPETRQLLIKSVVITVAISVAGAVGIVAVIAKNGGLDGLYKMLEALI